MKKLCLAIAVSALAACTTTSPDVIQRGDAQRLAQVYDATVLSVRPVTVDGSQGGLGAGAGAVAGGVAGSTIGHGGGSVVGAVLGAVAGGVLGNAVERGTTRENAVELVLQMRNGERRSVVQAVGNESWAPGEPVVLVVTGGRTRVQRAPAVAPQPVYPTSQPVPAYPQSQPVPVYPPSQPVPRS